MWFEGGVGLGGARGVWFVECFGGLGWVDCVCCLFVGVCGRGCSFA